MHTKLLSTVVWLSMCLGILCGISSVAVFDREKLNKRIQARKSYELETIDEINLIFEENLSKTTPVEKAVPISSGLDDDMNIYNDEEEEPMISNALFDSAFVPYCEKYKIMIPEDLWEEIKRTSKTQEEALYLAGFSLEESTWREDVIGDKHAQGSYGYFQPNKLWHETKADVDEKITKLIHPNFFSDKNIWQDPYYNLAAFRICFERTSGGKDNWYDKIVAYNVGPDMVGPPDNPRRGIKYADTIQSYVDDFKQQLNRLLQAS